MEVQSKGEQQGVEGVSSSVWRFEMATRASVVIDADGYFELIREAMLKAKQSIFLIGWDFDTRIHLCAGRKKVTQDDNTRFPARLGAFIVWLAKRTPGLRINILKWNFALIKSLFRGLMVFDLIRWSFKDRIDFKYDSAHPVGTSHHQKIVVIDDNFAVCGGIDMTSDRWDTRGHLHEDIRRKLPNGKFYAPWHDVTMLMEGDIAYALAELGRDRWITAGGKPLDRCMPQEGTAWPDRLVAEFKNVEVGIARTRAQYGNVSQVDEIEALFVEHIQRAERFLYAETQYFASRRIAEAIAERLDEPDPPEFVIINPRRADGWLEQQAMDTARVRLVRSLIERDHANRFRIYNPYTSGGTPIYVHAKLTIVDDEVLRVGSANMNNRSMGLDSECDVFIDARRPRQRRDRIQDRTHPSFTDSRTLRQAFRGGRAGAARIGFDDCHARRDADRRQAYRAPAYRDAGLVAEGNRRQRAARSRTPGRLVGTDCQAGTFPKFGSLAQTAGQVKAKAGLKARSKRNWTWQARTTAILSRTRTARSSCPNMCRTLSARCCAGLETIPIARAFAIRLRG